MRNEQDSAIKKQTLNRSTCKCTNKISEKFKDLPVISARRIQNINVDVKTSSEAKSTNSPIINKNRDSVIKEKNESVDLKEISDRLKKHIQMIKEKNRKTKPINK